MKCREFAEFIANYLSGDLPADILSRFEQHLTVCPNCVKYLRSYKETIALSARAFDDDGDDAVPATVPEQLVQAVLAARRKP